MKFQLKDLSMHYRIEGSGLPVLMLHGRPTDHEAMVAAFEPIFEARTGFQRIYVDLPGMGLSHGGSWICSNDDVLAVMLAFVDEVVGERPFLLIGFSYGGYIARGILHQRAWQAAGMMLLVPAMGRGAERILPEHRIFGQDTAQLAQYPQPFADMFASILVVHEAAIIARQGEILGGLQRADPAKMALLGENYQFSFPVDTPSAPFEEPVLIVTGKFDSVTGYEQAGELAKAFPRATYIVLDRAGHAAHMEQPALFNLLTHEWLDRVEEAQAG